MSKAKSLLGRAAVLLSTAAIATLAFSGLAAPAQAESPVLGTLALSPAGGSVNDTPFVTAATTPAACPTDFGGNAALKVGPVGAAGSCGEAGEDESRSIKAPSPHRAMGR